jgi:uncharacterized repeat protein (TIGR01451 family)
VHGGDAITLTLDLSESAGEPLITGTGMESLNGDQGTPTCTLKRRPNQVACGLDSLAAGAAVKLTIGARFDYQVPDSSLHMVVVTANETDTNPTDNWIDFGQADAGLSQADSDLHANVPPSPDLRILTDGPAQIVAGLPFTTTFTIRNGGVREATGVHFESALPPATTLISYAPDLPDCKRRPDALVCALRIPDSREPISFTLAINGHAGQPMILEPDPLMPGWPICIVIKERTYLHIVDCELGTLAPAQEIPVQLTLLAEGVQERQLTSTASVWANEPELAPADNLITTTATVSVRADLSLSSTLEAIDSTEGSVRYTLAVANLGPSDAADVTLRDTWPAGTNLISTHLSQGEDCLVEADDPTVTTVMCRLGRLGGGETANVSLVVAVDRTALPPTPETVSHRVAVESAQIDPDFANNVLLEEIPVSSLIDR